MYGHAGDQRVGGGVGGADEFLDLGDGDDGVLVEGFKNAMAVAGGAAEVLGDDGAVFFAQGEDSPDRYPIGWPT